jgi:UDP-3-O-[3-hydroxymyristoyl] N-acetylglucosamine deacetylase
MPILSINQKTVLKPVIFRGHGIHSSHLSQIEIMPAEPGHGIIFRIESNRQQVDIPLIIGNISNLTRSTGLTHRNISINTIEHLLFAFYTLKISNAIVTCTSDEIPAMDGAAWTFIQGLKHAGISEQSVQARIRKVSDSFTKSNGDSFISYQPSDSLKLTVVMDFPQKDLHDRSLHLDLDRTDLVASISKARTFGFDHEIQSLHERGLGLGGNLRNTVVVTKHGYRNLFLRYPDECLRHKVLDFLGDMFVSGSFFQGHFYVYKSGHKLDIEFLREFLKRAG